LLWLVVHMDSPKAVVAAAVEVTKKVPFQE
jgi:hypothetical protein